MPDNIKTMIQVIVKKSLFLITTSFFHLKTVAKPHTVVCITLSQLEAELLVSIHRLAYPKIILFQPAFKICSRDRAIPSLDDIVSRSS
jgi:hypothetical protein